MHPLERTITNLNDLYRQPQGTRSLPDVLKLLAGNENVSKEFREIFNEEGEGNGK